MAVNNPIWSKKECQKHYDEVMLKIALSSYAELHGEDLLAEKKQLEKEHKFQATPDINEFLNRQFRKKTMKTTMEVIVNHSYKILAKASMIFFVVSVLLASSMGVSAEFRSSVYKLIFTYEKEYTLVQLDKASYLEFVNSEVFTWNHAYAPTMLPKGYEVEDVIPMTSQYIVIYKNNKNGYIEFWQSNASSDGQWYADTQEANHVQNILINDSDGILISKDEVNTVIWRMGDVILNINSNEDTDTIISIAKNIKLLR